MGLKELVKGIPIIGNGLVKIRRLIKYRLDSSFRNSFEYWESRYQAGGNSGSGSYGHLAEFKATFLNKFLAEHKIDSVIEFGCGDGNQISLINYRKYIGFDISKTAIQICKNKFGKDTSKSFFLFDPTAFVDNHNLFRASVCLSLDVIYHIVEDDVFDIYMHTLFKASSQYVIIYSSNFNSDQMLHVKHRKVTDWVEKEYKSWKLLEVVENPYTYSEIDEENTSSAHFYIYRKV